MGFVSGQSRLSGTCPADGGGGGLISWNGDTGPAVTAVASDVPSTPVAPDISTDVQGALDFLARNAGFVKKVATVADLDLFAPAIAGVRTISVAVWLTAIIVLPVGESIAVTSTAVIFTMGGFVSGMIFNNPGPAITGPLVCHRVLWQQLNPAGSVFGLSSLGGSNIFMNDSVVLGDNVGTISNVFAGVAIQNTAFQGNVTGLVKAGIIGAFRGLDNAFISPVGAFVGIDHDPTLVLISAGKYTSNTGDFTGADQHLFRFSNAATYPTPAPPTSVFSVEMSGNAVSAPGTVIDEVGSAVSQVSTLTVTSVADGNLTFHYDSLDDLPPFAATGDAVADAGTLTDLFNDNIGHSRLGEATDNADGTFTIAFDDDLVHVLDTTGITGTSTIVENIDTAAVAGDVLTTQSLELISVASVGSRSSAYVGVLEFFDLAAPLTIAIASADTFTVMPWTDGVSSSLSVGPAMERFRFVRASTGGPADPAFPLDWALEFDGTLVGNDVAMAFQASPKVGSGGGTDNISCEIQFRADRTASWKPAGAFAVTEMSAQFQAFAGAGTVRGVAPTYQFRFGGTNQDGATDIDIGNLNMTVKVEQ